MRQVICDLKYEGFLTGLGQNNKFSIGLIIGQIVENGKDLVVHLSATPKGEKKSDDDEQQEVSSVIELENALVADHALNALRMIVGGFNILGLFVVSEKNIMSDNAALQKLKTILMDIKSTLDSNGLLYANTDQIDKGDKLLLNFISTHKNFICKTISIDPSKATASNPVDWKFGKSGEWKEFETYYEVDTYFPLPHANNHFDTEKNVMATIDVINENLNSALLFFDDEPLDKELTLEKLSKIKKENKLETDRTKVTIYSQVPKLAKNDSGKLKVHSSLAHYTGIISSRVFGSSRNTIGEIETYIKNDIIRSLTTRMQIYYDALLANDDGGNDDTSGQDQDVNSTNPPRRVFYPIGNGNILFGDYLFQNETEETTVKQSMDILGVKLTEAEINSKAEMIVQLNFSGHEKSETVNTSHEEPLSSKDTNRLILILGTVGALVALLIAIVLYLVTK